MDNEFDINNNNNDDDNDNEEEEEEEEDKHVNNNNNNNIKEEKEETIVIPITEENLKLALKYKDEGNVYYKDGNIEEAIIKWSKGIELFEFDKLNKNVSALYANRAAGNYKLSQYELVIEDCKKALEIDPNYCKAALRRCEAYEKLEKYAEAILDIDLLIKIDSNNSKTYILKREKLVKEKSIADEKMKAEVLGKLKDFGNTILGKFGLSTDNFKMQQDPKTGSYSVNFQQ
jgi:tetratricopeptide (TPR) repeat protein